MYQMKIMQLNNLHVLLFLHQIPGSCMRQASCVLDMMAASSQLYGEKVIALREWGYLLSPRRQSIGRADWEKLPWKEHLCCVFTRSCEMGRLHSYYRKTRQFERLRHFLDDCRYNHTEVNHEVGKTDLTLRERERAMVRKLASV